MVQIRMKLNRSRWRENKKAGRWGSQVVQDHGCGRHLVGGEGYDAVGVGDSVVNVAVDARSTAAVEVGVVEESIEVASEDASSDGAAAAAASCLMLESTSIRPSMRSAIVDCSLGADSPAMEESDGVWICT